MGLATAIFVAVAACCCWVSWAVDTEELLSWCDNPEFAIRLTNAVPKRIATPPAILAAVASIPSLASNSSSQPS